MCMCYVSVWYVHMPIGAHGSQRHWFPRNWSYRRLWAMTRVLGIGLGFSVAGCALNSWVISLGSLFCFSKQGFSGSPGCSGTHHVNQAGCEFTELCLPLTPNAGIKSICHHAQLVISFSKVQCTHGSGTLGDSHGFLSLPPEGWSEARGHWASFFVTLHLTPPSSLNLELTILQLSWKVSQSPDPLLSAPSHLLSHMATANFMWGRGTKLAGEPSPQPDFHFFFFESMWERVS